jgi:NADH dehydrogenase
MVENAIQTAHGAAENIVSAMRGKEQKKVTVEFHGTMVSVGNYFCVSEIMGKSLPVWLSILMKFLVNIHYLWEITGFRGISRYLYHELLERRQTKNLVEQHYSTRMQAWWLAPLRLFLGGMWLYEGIVKVAEGWLSSPKLASFLGMATDATSAASGNASFITRVDDAVAIKTGIINFFLGTETRLVEGVEISAQHFSKVEFFHFGDFSLVPWFLQNVVLANDGVAMFFQVLVCILEIVIGLMLLGGAFTFIGSVISFGLIVMFLTSTGLYEKSWWMLFASIATMGGAGRAFGLDYYITPYLNNVWESYWKNKKFRLFFKRSLDRFE